MISKSKKITICAMMVALSTILAWLSNMLPFKWLQGGSITLASMVPVVVASVVVGTKWGLLTSVVYALIQMLLGGISAPPVQDFLSYVLVILLDYIVAFGVLGFAGFFYKRLGKKDFAIPVSACIVSVLRFLCHLLSGIIIWDVYAPEGQSVFMYSLIYNGGYMLPEIIITTVVTMLLIPIINTLMKNHN